MEMAGKDLSLANTTSAAILVIQNGAKRSNVNELNGRGGYSS
jgi:hypothetical protein